MSEEKSVATADVTDDTLCDVVNKDVLEEALSRVEGRDITVSNFSITKAAAFGEGFMSVVHAVQAETVEDRATKTESLIVKTLSSNQAFKQVTLDMGLFRKETAFYSIVVPDLIEFQRQRHTTPWKAPFPRFYSGFEDQEKVKGLVILEDLRPLGFKKADVKTGLDYDHCALVITELAKYHALSFAKIKEDKEFLSKKLHDTLFDVYRSDVIAADFQNSLKNNVATAMSLYSSSPLSSNAELTSQVQDTFSKLAEDPLGIIRRKSSPDDQFCVLCHGDTWCNNVLFRYDDQLKTKPVEIKLLDFQTWRLCPPTTDLAYFFFTSTTQDLRKRHLEDFLRLYHVTFMDTLREVGVKAPEFTLEALKKMFKETAMFGVLVALDGLPAFLLDPSVMQGLEGQQSSYEEFVASVSSVVNKEGDGSESLRLMQERIAGVLQDTVTLGLTWE